MCVCKVEATLTQYVGGLCLEALRLLALQHVQQGLQAAQAQRGVGETSLLDQLEDATQPDADDLGGRTRSYDTVIVEYK